MLNFPFPYLLYIGNAYPHKNLERLLRAFKILISNIPALPAGRQHPTSNIQLVLVGKGDFFYQHLKKVARELGLSEQIIFTGPIRNDDLKEVYKKAIAYIAPALMEGFGLPGLEAMANGCPVVSSKAGPLPEIYGEAALYFDPENTEEMAEKIKTVIENDGLRKELREKGFNQVKKYSWQRCAEETLEVYRSVIKI